MEQIFMIEVYVKKIVMKLEEPEKDEYELKLEAEEAKREADALAALEALKAMKKGKKAPKKPKKPKKGKKGKKEPPLPSEEEMKFLQTCTMNMNCAPLFDFLIAHDNFVAPPPPPPPPKKGKKGKKPKPKPKKGKKKKGKLVPRTLILPSEPLPQPPFFGVGSSVIFLSRPSNLEEILRETPIYITVWNRDQTLNCVGFCRVNWHESFFDCLKKAEDLNPVDYDKAELRDTSKPEIVSNTVELVRPLECEEDLKPSGEIEFYIRLSCLGNSVVTNVVSLPELERIPGRKYVNDDLRLKDLEVVRHWDGTAIEMLPPVAYFFGAIDITREPIKPVDKEVHFEDFKAPFTKSELAILAMGFPKGPCGGTNCPKRLEYRGSQHQFIPGEMVKEGKKGKAEYQPGQFVNKRDVHGPCGRLDCPLAKKIRAYLCNEGAYKVCKKPCPPDYY